MKYIIKGEEGGNCYCLFFDVFNQSIKTEAIRPIESRFNDTVDGPVSGQYRLEIALSAGFELTKRF